MKILVTDDAGHILTLLRTFLTRKGHHCIEAGTAEAGLRKLEEENPEIVFLDVELPDRNGLEVLQKIRRAQPEIKVIVMSGWADDFLGGRMLELGALDFITKPFDFDELDQLLDKVSGPSGS